MEEKINGEDLPALEVQAELKRLLQSPVFAQSDRLGRFLRFAVENALAGTTDALKEYVIGAEVYDRKPPYHPSQDSIVRTEARRLRTKLKEYYESEGKANPLFIYFRPGSYVPVFRKNETASNATAQERLVVEGAGVAVAVLPFVDLSRRPLSAKCAEGITDEVAHTLSRTSGVRVVSRASLSQFLAAPYDLQSLSAKLGVQNFIEGTVREENNQLRITARVLSADGFQLSSHRFDTAATADSSLSMQEQIATAFISRARPEQSLVRQRKAAPGAVVMAAYPFVMHAETMLDEGTTTDVPSALVKFQEAHDVAPGWARPFCGIAYCNTELALRGAHPSWPLLAQAKTAALRSVELDPEMIEPYSCLGVAQALEWRWDDAEASFHKGASLGLHVSAARRHGLLLTALGRFDEASHQLEIAQRIDPFSNRQKIARLRFLHLSRRHEEGIRPASDTPIYGPLPVEAKFEVALMHAMLGNHEQAMLLLDTIRPASSADLPMLASVAEVLALSGDQDQAKQMTQSLQMLSPQKPVSRFRQALLACALADPERSLALLTQSVNDHEAEAAWIMVEPRFDRLRARPSFEDLVRTVFPGLRYPAAASTWAATR